MVSIIRENSFDATTPWNEKEKKHEKKDLKRGDILPRQCLNLLQTEEGRHHFGYGGPGIQFLWQIMMSIWKRLSVWCFQRVWWWSFPGCSQLLRRLLAISLQTGESVFISSFWWINSPSTAYPWLSSAAPSVALCQSENRSSLEWPTGPRLDHWSSQSLISENERKKKIILSLRQK